MLSSSTIDTTDDAVVATGPAAGRPRRQAQSPPRDRQQQRIREQQRQREAANVAGLARGIWGLAKFAFFIYILYHVGLFLMAIPEVNSVVTTTVKTGEMPDAQPALDALRQRLEDLVGDTNRSREQSEAELRAAEAQAQARERELPPEPSANAPTERSNAGDKDFVAAPTNVAPDNPNMPRVVKRVAPQYTDAARRARIEGTVQLRAMVNEDGNVQFVSVTRSLDKEYGLDEQAMMALRQWVFDPARKDGVPTRAYVQVQMTFSLK